MPTSDVTCPCHMAQHAALPRIEGHICCTLREALDMLGYNWPVNGTPARDSYHPQIAWLLTSLNNLSSLV